MEKQSIWARHAPATDSTTTKSAGKKFAGAISVAGRVFNSASAPSMAIQPVLEQVAKVRKTTMLWTMPKTRLSIQQAIFAFAPFSKPLFAVYPLQAVYFAEMMLFEVSIGQPNFSPVPQIATHTFAEQKNWYKTENKCKKMLADLEKRKRHYQIDGYASL